MGPLGSAALALGKPRQGAGDPEGVRSDDARADPAQGIGRALAPPQGFGDADDTVLALEFDNVAQSVRRVETIGTPQRRVGDRDRVDS